MKTKFWPDTLSTAVRTYTYMRINCLSFKFNNFNCDFMVVLYYPAQVKQNND